jgi:hypothetical protein
MDTLDFHEADIMVACATDLKKAQSLGRVEMKVRDDALPKSSCDNNEVKKEVLCPSSALNGCVCVGGRVSEQVIRAEKTERGKGRVTRCGGSHSRVVRDPTVMMSLLLSLSLSS